VNAICPGYIETELNRDFFASPGGERLIETLPRRRLGQPEDLDGVIKLLASRESRIVNGAVITADDGYTAG
jgi:NAD(P)-dependent dehydrogenase (short-subunit alcohol dehydrogenase family)